MNSAEMSSAQITDYLKKVMELESVRYELSMAQERLPICVRGSFCNQKYLSPRPSDHVDFQEEKPVYSFSEYKPYINDRIDIGLGSFAVIASFFALVLGISAARFLGFILLFMIFAAPCIFVIGFRRTKNKEEWRLYHEKEKQAKDAYNSKLQEYYDRKNRSEEAHVAELSIWQKEYREWKDEDDRLKNLGEVFFRKNLDMITASAQATENALQQLYDKDLIFPKYRNLNAISTMYEYFVSGRVTQLAGPDGAYNLYETELRQNLIIGELRNINENLEQIKKTSICCIRRLNVLAIL